MCLLFKWAYECNKWLYKVIVKALCYLLYPLRIFSFLFNNKFCVNTWSFLGGYFLGNLYYYCLLTKIPFSPTIHSVLSLSISLLLGIGNLICRQLRCICLLTIPMYCGKPGRGVLKALVLTYVIAGPITNMCMNAKEVVRVFACSAQLSGNLTQTKYTLLEVPFKQAVTGLDTEIEQVKDTLRSFKDVAAPIDHEMTDENEIIMSQNFNFDVDYVLGGARSKDIELKYKILPQDQMEQIYLKKYLKKLEYRCQDQLSRAITVCIEMFLGSYEQCHKEVPRFAAWVLCWPMKITYICNFLQRVNESDCDSRLHVDSSLGLGYLYLKKVSGEFLKNLDVVNMQQQFRRVDKLEDIQDAKETGERIMHAFEEKNIMMSTVIHAFNFCVALLFLRIIIAAGSYHDNYLTSIGHDNVYITSYFKRIDKRRKKRQELTLLPLKKMERTKYVDVHSLRYMAECNELLTHVLKVMLEMITATTFIMLDRLFYEALDVVRQHASMEFMQQGTHDVKIEVQGSGLLANIVQKILKSLQSTNRVKRSETNRLCLPQPRLMPPIFYLKIYGGYLWIQLLLYLNPYTIRLSRIICSCFYWRREKQRILHLYNDILKKRLKLQKTLRKKAVQAVRAHYLSGENMLSLRMKYPQLLGWLKIFSAARMTCLICGETEPRNQHRCDAKNCWHKCDSPKCPFVYCPECWAEVGARCLACDPSLAELSDVDSLSEDER